MDADEASECAKLVGAKHNIPVHEIPIDSADATVAEYDEAKLEAFQAPGRIILVPGAELHRKGFSLPSRICPSWGQSQGCGRKARSLRKRGAGGAPLSVPKVSNDGTG